MTEPIQRTTTKERENPKHLELLMKWYNSDDELKDFVGYNLMTHNFQYLKSFEGIEKGDFFEKRHLAILKWYFVREHNIQFSDALLIQFMELVSYKHKIHPIKDWLNSLKWDGLERLDSWLNMYVGCELNAYTSALGRIVLCAAVARVYHPGTKFDIMMILEGPQGVMKSSILEELGGQWFLNMSFDHQEKTNIEKMLGSWIIEVADLGGFRRADVEWLRAFLTRRVDRCRLPYDMGAKDFARQTIFVGTTNPSGDNEYLKDDTGNRRFCPIEVNKINIIGFREVREQLWAEAVIKYRQGVKLYLEGEALLLAQEVQNQREENDIWMPKIRVWLMTQEQTNTIEILYGAVGVSLQQIKQWDRIRIGKIMKKLGWERRQANSGDWFYHRPPSWNVVIKEQKDIMWNEE